VATPRIFHGGRRLALRRCPIGSRARRRSSDDDASAGARARVARSTRHLLLRGPGSLAARGWERLEHNLRADDATGELGAARGIEEQLRRQLVSATLADAHDAKMVLRHHVAVADMPETDRLSDTICAWWAEIEVLIVASATDVAPRPRTRRSCRVRRSVGRRPPRSARRRMSGTGARSSLRRAPTPAREWRPRR